MSADTHHNVYDFPECHSVIICGDIHGDFNLLVNKVCVQYQRKMHRYTHNSVDDERLSINLIHSSLLYTPRRWPATGFPTYRTEA